MALPLSLTRERRAEVKKPAKPAAPSLNPKKPDPKRPDSKRPDPFAFPDADPFDFTGESCEGERPVQKLVRQKTSSSAGQPSSGATGAAEVDLELHLSERSKTGYLHVNHAGSRYRAEVRTVSLGNYDTAVEAAAAVAKHLHLTATAAPAPAPAPAEEEELEYVIECVLEQRKQGRTTRYLVKWKGYDQAKEITWEPAASLKDTAALEEYLAPRLDIMGNRWSLGDASVSVQPAGSDEAVTLATPAPPTALACDFGGYVWLLAAAKLYRLDPRGPAAWSNPAVSTAAEPATTHGSRRPRARARRPSGLQSSAAAARPPAVPPWSLSLVEGAAQSVGLDIQARATPTTAWRGAIALARPRWAAWACTTEMAARTRPGWRLLCPRHLWRCSRPAPPTTSSSRCPRRGRARCHASCSAYHDSIEPCVAHCRVQDARPPAATPPSALLHHPPHTITRPHPPRCATGGARRRWWGAAGAASGCGPGRMARTAWRAAVRQPRHSGGSSWRACLRGGRRAVVARFPRARAHVR